VTGHLVCHDTGYDHVLPPDHPICHDPGYDHVLPPDHPPHHPAVYDCCHGHAPYGQ
jgi:hypothetical protein